METAINVISLRVLCCLSWNKTTSAHEHRHKGDFFLHQETLNPESKKELLIIWQGGGLRTPSLIAIY